MVGTSSPVTKPWKEFIRITTPKEDSYGKITFLVTRITSTKQETCGVLSLSYTWLNKKYNYSLEWLYISASIDMNNFASDLWTAGVSAVRVFARVKCVSGESWLFTVLEENVKENTVDYGENGWILFHSITADGDAGTGNNYWTNEFKVSHGYEETIDIPTPAEGTIQVINGFLEKRNGIVHFVCYCKILNEIQENKILFTIPEAFRPKKFYYGSGILYTDTANMIGNSHIQSFFKIQTDGSFSMIGFKNNYHMIDTTYISEQ